MEFIYVPIAFILLVYCYLRLTSPKPPHKSPPTASGARPFTGHLHLMISSSPSAPLPHISLAALADQHGPIFSIRLGSRRAVVVSGSDLAKHLFTTRDAAVSTRPQVRAAKHLSYGFAMFGFEIRKLVAVEIFSSRRLDLLRHVRVSETGESINGLYNLWAERRDESGRALVEMREWFGELNCNVTLRMVARKRFSGGGAEMRRCKVVMRDFFRLAGMFVAADTMPYLGWLDLGGHEKRMKETARELDGIVGGWLVEHRKKEYSGEDGDHQDFMDVMVSLVRSGNEEYDADTIIKATCQMLIVGGSDTTTVMLVWALCLLLNNRSVLRKAQDELDEQVGRERRVNESDIDNLTYLQAIVKETLRLYPAGPFAFREFTEDCNVQGYHVPRGTWLIVNLWKLHRDPHVWGDDVLEFKPERFLDGCYSGMDVRGQDFELIPFGAGRRICPGTSFGLHMLHLVLASLLQGFDLGTVGDEAVDMSESVGLTNSKATPLDVLVAPRLSPALY